MAIDSTATIHKTAIIEQGAKIGAGCSIGAFCTIGPQVTLGQNVNLRSHVVVEGDTEIGDDTTIWQFASVGSQPQDLKFAGEKTRLVIGKRNMIRESVSINPGTAGGGGITVIGDDCLLMLGAHVGHDCHVGNKVVMANHCSLAGHVQVGDGVILGGMVGVHQYCRIGKYAIIGALSMVAADVIPYGSVVSERAGLAGLNLIGLKRAEMKRSEIHALRAAYSEIFSGDDNLKTRAKKAQAQNAGVPAIQEITDFILGETSRSFCTPKEK